MVATTAVQVDLESFAVDSSLSTDSIYDLRIEYLHQVAAQAQAELLAYLAQCPSVESIVPFWLASRVAFIAPPEVILAVAARSDVGLVTDNYVIELPELQTAEPPDDPEWNIRRVQADDCWAADVTGTGVVVGTIDTGVDHVHPAFHGRWRSVQGWHDAVAHQPAPYDDNAHGTAVMGAICGGDGLGADQNDIGVAPGAQFIAAKAFDYGRMGRIEDILDCLEWMAEHGRPDVLCNSWGSRVEERTRTDCWEEIGNLRGLGIVVVFSVGNSGPPYNTSVSPGSFPKVISTGAVDEDDDVAEFSSR